MKLITFFPLLLCLILCTHDASSQWEDEEPTTMRPITFLQAVLQSDIVQRKIQGVIDLIDLKLHHLRILKDLFTTENLITLRRTLEWTVSATNLLIRILPDNPERSSVATILQQLVGPASDEATDSLDRPIALDLDPYPTNVHLPVFQNTIDSSADDGKSLDDISINRRSVGAAPQPAPVFENQLRFGGAASNDEEEDLGGSADNEAVPSERDSTVVAGGDVVKEGNGQTVQVVLKPEELSVLQSYGMDPEEAMRLATLLYETRAARTGRAARASLEGEVRRAAGLYGDESPQAMSLARLIRGPYL